MSMLRKTSLICGIISSLLYAATDMLGGMLWKGYSFTYQPVSDLNAIGSPSRWFVFPFFTIYSILFFVFALGVWMLPDKKRALSIIGGLLLGLGIINLLAIFTPEHLGEPATSLANTIHIAFAGVTSILILMQVGAGAFVARKWFRTYSAGTLLILLMVGALAGLGGAQYVANQGSPLIGVTERILIYGYMQWVVLLAFVLLHTKIE